MFDFSLESMNAQVQSKLGKELDAIWQKAIDYRDGELKGKSYDTKLRALRKLFRDDLSKKFIDVVWKYTGLYVKRVELYDWNNGASFCTWIFMDKGDENQRGTFQIENILDGGYLRRRFGYLLGPNKPHYTTDELVKLSKSYDVSKGAISPSSRMEIRKLVRSVINMDLSLGFLIEDQLAKNSGLKNFTAQELTAIMLHEIGHTMTLIEHAADMYARMSTFKFIAEAWKSVNGKNVDEAFYLADKTAEALEEAGHNEQAAQVRKIKDKIKEDIASSGKQSSKNVLDIIFGLIIFCLTLWSDIFVIPCNMLFGGDQQKRFAHSEQKKKFADIPVNMRMITWQERKADEYAFSHGYGAHQVTALHKLYAFFDRYGLSEKACDKLNLSEKLHKGIGFLATVKLLVFAPAYANGYGYELYPAGVKRFRELMNLTLQQVKSHSNSPEYIKKYMEDCDVIMDRMDNRNAGEEAIAKIMRGYDLFMRYASLPSFITWIVNGHVKREIEDLINDIDKVGNNLLTYFGIKIQQMSK